MRSPPFDYYDPESLDEALTLVARYGDGASLLAGGQSLVPLMNFRLARPDVLIDLNRVQALSHVLEKEGGLSVGAMTRQSTIETSGRVGEKCPLLSEAVRLIGHASIRNRGTIGGSLAHADPAAELGAVTLCLEAEIEIGSRERRRSVPARDFFEGPYTTCIQSNEMLLAVRFPALPAGGRSAFLELSRREGDFALVGVAALIVLGEDGSCRQARIAFCGAGPAPCRAESAERALAGNPFNRAAIAEAASLAARGLEPFSDVHASSGYRRQLASVLSRRVLERLMDKPNRQTGEFTSG